VNESRRDGARDAPEQHERARSMTIAFRFTCELATGLHARPASLLAEASRAFRAISTITNIATGERADLASVLSVIALDVQRGHEALIEADGDEARALIDRVRALVDEGFGESNAGGNEPGDSQEHSATRAHGSTRVPRPILRSGATIVRGVGACPGIGEGVIVATIATPLPDEASLPASRPTEIEHAYLRDAMRLALADLDRSIREARSGAERDVLSAHRQMLADPALARRIEGAIASGHSAGRAVLIAAREFMGRLSGAASATIRQRATDVHEVCRRLLVAIEPTLLAERPIALTSPSIVASESLSVHQLASLDRSLLRGLVLGDVGSTSHVVILARSMHIPTIIGADDLVRMAPGARAIVDANAGFAVIDPPPDVASYFARESSIHARRMARLAPLIERPGSTRDGVALHIAANAATPEEIRRAIALGAESIGLMRTEMLFLDRNKAPSEDEQHELYKAAALSARGDRGGPRGVTIRTLDIGGDKPAPYLRIPHEHNPFLGCRGVRIHERHPALLRTQLRAVCRASAHGTIRVMAPMVATLREARWFVAQVEQVQKQLAAEGVAHDLDMPIGVMLEVPSLALVIDKLASAVDFVSVGTNDLCQYFYAADRMNPSVAALNDPREPSFLRLLDRIARDAARHALPVSICGEMASEPDLLPLLTGFANRGLSSISVAPGAIASIKPALAALAGSECDALLDRSLACESAFEVRAVLASHTSINPEAPSAPPLSRDLLLMDCDARAKEEAIQELVGVLHLTGRIRDPRAVEDAVWAREETYATGLGHGFAIPHCRTDDVRSASIAIARLKNPIEWGSSDGQPVQIAILLAVPRSTGDQTHLKLLAKLSRRLMHEEFRDSLRNSPDADALLAVLEKELDLLPA
jgi:fructose-specific PTS system IIA-like component